MWRHTTDVQADWRKRLNLRSGSQRHRHFIGFFNVPVQAPTRAHPIYGYSEKPPFSRILRHAGDTEDLFHLKPRGPNGEAEYRNVTRCKHSWRTFLQSKTHNRLVFLRNKCASRKVIPLYYISEMCRKTHKYSSTSKSSNIDIASFKYILLYRVYNHQPDQMR